MSDPFIAEVRIFAGNFAPAGFAFCDGQLVPIAQNTALFSIIGTTYGGDGRTTTALPNLQGRVPMHSGDGPGLTDRRLGERAGENTASLNDSQTPSHSWASSAARACPTASSVMVRALLFETIPIGTFRRPSSRWRSTEMERSSATRLETI